MGWCAVPSVRCSRPKGISPRQASLRVFRGSVARRAFRWYKVGSIQNSGIKYHFRRISNAALVVQCTSRSARESKRSRRSGRQVIGFFLSTRFFPSNAQRKRLTREPEILLSKVTRSRMFFCFTVSFFSSCCRFGYMWFHASVFECRRQGAGFPFHFVKKKKSRGYYIHRLSCGKSGDIDVFFFADFVDVVDTTVCFLLSCGLKIDADSRILSARAPSYPPVSYYLSAVIF